MKKTSSPSNLNATKKFSPINLNSVYKPNGARPGQNGRMLLGTVKKVGGVKKAPPPAAPKPLNLPSQKKENAGYDPKIAIVPSGGSGWSGAEGPVPNGHPSAEHSEAPEPTLSNAGTTAPAPETMTQSMSPAKAVAWGGRGMTKPAPKTPPTAPPQMMPIRPTEDLNRFMGGPRWGPSSGPRGENRRTPGGEQFPPLAPKGEAVHAEKPSMSNGPLMEKINTVRDDSWADVDDEMNYDDADNLFDDSVVKNPAPKEMSPEEARALKVMRMEAELARQEEEAIARRAADLAAKEEAERAERAEKAEKAEKAERAERAERDAAAKRVAEPEMPPPEPEAAPAEQVVDIGATMRSLAETAFERRQREEEQRQAEQKARADERLRILNEAAAQRKKEEEAQKKKDLEARLQDARKLEEQTQQKHEEENRRWQTKSAWSAPERSSGVDSANWRDSSEATNEEHADTSPSSILKRDTNRETSRRKLWVPSDSEKPHERPAGGKGDRDRAIYEKKFNVNDSRNWRERAVDSKEKEREEKKKRDKDQRKKSSAVVTKVEKKSDNKTAKKEDNQGKSGRAESQKKEGSSISLPAPLPKEANESTENQVAADHEPSKTPNASWSYNKIRKYCDQNGIKKWCEQQNTPIKMSEKEDLLAKYKLWAYAREKGEITNQDKPKRTRASRGSRGKKDDKKTEDKDDAGASPEDGEDDEKKRRTSRGSRKNRKEDSSRHSKEDPKLNEKPEGKVEAGSKSGPLLDEQMGLQDIACGLKVGPDGGYAVVESHETVEDDSGFTTEVGKKEKKAQMREEAQQKEKAARRQRLKEAAKAKQQDKEKAKADATKAKSNAKPTPEGSGTGSGGSPQGNPAAYPAPVTSEFRGAAVQDLGAQPGPAKQAWGPKPAEKEKTDFTSIMLDQKYKQTFPEQRMPFEVPAPKDPVPGGSAPVGAERLDRKLSGSEHDIWANNSTTPNGASGFTSPFGQEVGSTGFSGPNFNSSAPYGGGLITLTPATAQFTALPSFSSNAFTNTFSAAPGVSDGWGNSETVPGPSPFVQQQLGPTDSSAVNPAGWSSQKPVGASRNDSANPNSRASNGKGGAAGEKQNRKSRGGKGRGGKDNKGGKDNVASKNKDGNSAKADQGQQAKATRGGRQNRRPANQSNGGKSGAKSGNGSADKPIAPVDAVIPAKSGNRRGGRHAKKGNHASSDKN